jgi:tRNA pseudouridine55 synthase
MRSLQKKKIEANQKVMTTQPLNDEKCAKEELPSGILLIDKPASKTSFALVGVLRRFFKVKKIGHAGTLDPFATGVMVMLIGKQYTKLSDRFLGADKEYIATVRLGIETDSYDCDGNITWESSIIPSLNDIVKALLNFQGEILQIPPMFSAKKKNGQKLYDLARKGITVEREPVLVKLATILLRYEYPYLELRVTCSKGTYIRSIANDLGKLLGCGAHLTTLQRTKSGKFYLENCIDGALLYQPNCDIEYLKTALIKDIENFF